MLDLPRTPDGQRPFSSGVLGQGSIYVQDQNRQPNPTEAMLKRALSHPKRLEILGCLTKKEAGTSEEELIEALGLTPSRVRYHLAVLQSADLIAHVDRASGALDQYVATASAGT